jgi:hypothetical protein
MNPRNLFLILNLKTETRQLNLDHYSHLGETTHPCYNGLHLYHHSDHPSHPNHPAPMDHCPRGHLFDDLLRHSNRCRCRGCDGIPFIVIILIITILSHAVESKLFIHLHDQLITGLDHSFQSGILLPQLLSVFPQPLAQGL